VTAIAATISAAIATKSKRWVRIARFTVRFPS
jgi:hypothetical protein